MSSIGRAFLALSAVLIAGAPAAFAAEARDRGESSFDVTFELEDQ